MLSILGAIDLIAGFLLLLSQQASPVPQLSLIVGIALILKGLISILTYYMG